MCPLPVSRKRLISAILVGWLAVIGFDFFLHGGLLAKLYVGDSDFLLSPKQAFKLIPLGYLSFLMFQTFVVWLLVRMAVRDWKGGARLGLKVGAFTWGSLVLGLLSISTAPWPLMAGWFLGQTVEAGIGGAVAGALMASRRPGKVVLTVVVFFLAMVVVTVVMQSVGLAPAMERAH